jgi:hypothetical protein
MQNYIPKDDTQRGDEGNGCEGILTRDATEDHIQASLGSRTSAARSNGSAPSPGQEHQCHDRVEARGGAI